MPLLPVPPAVQLSIPLNGFEDVLKTQLGGGLKTFNSIEWILLLLNDLAGWFKHAIFQFH